MSNPRFIKNILYSLKRRFGVNMEFVFKISTVTDSRTGKVTVSKDSFLINRGILLPSAIERDFTYNLTFIASNKNFAYGGLYETDEARIILDGIDLLDKNGSFIEPDIGMSLIFNGNRWDIKQVQRFQIGNGFLIRAKQNTTIDLENLIQRFLHTDLILNQAVEVL